MLETVLLTEQPTAVRRAILDLGQLAAWIPAACADVACYLYRRGIVAAGYPFARYYWLGADLIEVETGVPVASPIAGDGVVEPSSLPSGPALIARLAGPSGALAQAHRSMDEWLEKRGADRSAGGWVVYHNLPACNRATQRIDLVQPIAFAAAAA